MKTTPFSPPSGPAQRLFQEHPAKSKLLAAGLAAFNIFGAGAAHAALLAYEGFNYTTGDAIPGGTGVALNGQGSAGELGLTGTWTTSNTGSLANSTTVYPGGIATGITQNNNASVANPFNGMVANLATSGGFFGVSNASNTDGNWTNATDHIFAHRSLASSVTATFVTGNTTWFSFVSARGYSANARSPSFYIGAGNLIADRGNNATAPGIGGGGSNNDGPRIFPTYWNNGLLPTIDNTTDPDGKLLFVFRRSDEAHADDGTTIAVQYGNNLTGWTTAAHQGTGIEDITISSVPDGPGFSQVTVALPASLTDSGKLFARLNVVVTSP